MRYRVVSREEPDWIIYDTPWLDDADDFADWFGWDKCFVVSYYPDWYKEGNNDQL